MLTLDSLTPTAGGYVHVFFGDHDFSTDGGQKYLAWYSGLTLELTEIDSDGKTQVPSGLQGIVYVVAVHSPDGTIGSQLTLLSGFNIAEFHFPSYVENP